MVRPQERLGSDLRGEEGKVRGSLLLPGFPHTMTEPLTWVPRDPSSIAQRDLDHYISRSIGADATDSGQFLDSWGRDAGIQDKACRGLR